MKSNPRVREVMASLDSIERGFEDIMELSRRCRFTDCTHTSESDCAVSAAVGQGKLAQDRLNSYLQQRDEAEYVSTRPNKTKAMDYMKQLKIFSRE